MIADLQAALVAWFDSERAEGGRLAALRTVRSGDSAPIYGPEHPILTVDTGDGIELDAGTTGATMGFPFDVTLYALNQAGPNEAVQTLGALLYTLGPGGVDLGLIPSLLVLQQRGLRAGGLCFRVRVDNPRMGILRDEMGVTAGAVVPVTMTLQRGIPAA